MGGHVLSDINCRTCKARGTVVPIQYKAELNESKSYAVSAYHITRDYSGSSKNQDQIRSTFV